MMDVALVFVIYEKVYPVFLVFVLFCRGAAVAAVSGTSGPYVLILSHDVGQVMKVLDVVWKTD